MRAAVLALALLLFPAVSHAGNALQVSGAAGAHMGGAGGRFGDPVQQLSTWFYVRAAVNRPQVIFLAVDNVLLNGWFVRIGPDGTTLQCGTAVQGAESRIAHGPSIPPAEWYFVALSRSGSTIRAYVGDEVNQPSGVSCTVTDPALPAQTGNYGLGYGGVGTPFNASLDGRLTSFRQFTRTQSLAEIQAEYASLGVPASLVGLYSNNPVTGLNTGYGSTAGTPGFTFASMGSTQAWTTAVGGGPVISGTPPPPPAGLTLTILMSGNGSGTVTSTPAGLSCGPTCSAIFAPDTSMSLTAIAAPGSTFTGWSYQGGAPDPTNNPLNFPITINASITAVFTLVAAPPPPGGLAGDPAPWLGAR